MMDIQIVEECSLTSRLKEAFQHCLSQCFPADAEFFRQSRAWQGCEPSWTVFIEDAEGVIAHMGIVHRQIEVGGKPVLVAGIQNVGVIPAHRGQGLTRKIMGVAMPEALRRGYEYGLLFCHPSLVEPYRKLQWHELAHTPVTRVDEEGQEKPLPDGNLAMCFPLSKARFPDGLIHLNGNDW